MKIVIFIIIAVVILIIAAFVVFLLIYRKKLLNYDTKNDSKKIILLNDNTFHNKISGSVAIVDFWAEWCQPCKLQAPIISELAEEMSDKVKVCKIDVEKNKIVASKLGIKSIPTIVIFKNGKEKERFVGVKTKQVLKKSLEQYLLS
jgi:thioredoxin 1